MQLGDVESLDLGHGVKLAPGALIGILSQHGGARPGPGAEQAAKSVIAALEAHRSLRLDRQTLVEAYDAALSVSEPAEPLRPALAAWWPADDATDELKERSVAAVGSVGSWLLHTSPDAGPVRVGMMLLSVLPTGVDHLAEIAAAGRHEELALSSAQAMRRLWGIFARTDRPDVAAGIQHALWGLAQEHAGWGRVHAVEALLQTDDPEIRRWLLEDGFRNRVDDQYLALSVAVHADLAGALHALAARTVSTGSLQADDRRLLSGARDLISAMAKPHGPGGTLDDYPPAAQVALEWLAVAGSVDPKALELADLRLIADIHKDALDMDVQDVVIFERCAALLGEPALVDAVRTALLDPSRADWRLALDVGRAMGLEVVGPLVARLRTDPDDGALWWDLTRSSAPPELVVELALELLPEDLLATSPRATIPIGAGHSGAIAVLQDVCGRHGIGSELICRGLSSPDAQIVGKAIGALRARPLSSWPPEVRVQLAGAARRETDPRRRASIEAMLHG